MKRQIFIFILSLALPFVASAALTQSAEVGPVDSTLSPKSTLPLHSSLTQSDSAVFAALEPKLKEYLDAMDQLTEQAARAEVDFLISTVQDEAVRNMVAASAYRHFRDSKVMGSENIAVYIYDEWFASFKAVFPTIEELDDAEFYAFINRKSLIGAHAQKLVLKDVKEREISLPAKSRKSVIFFYSASCPKCLFTSHQLRDFLAAKNTDDKWVKRLKINVYNIYAGEDDTEWEEYVDKNLKFVKRCKLKTYNLKGGEADYVTSYSVIQTPRLFLVGEDETIIGRNLDVSALKILLKSAL